jgi:spore germination protein GerM
MNRWIVYILAALVLGGGYYIALTQPTEIDKQIATGEVYIYFARSGETDIEMVPVRRDIAVKQTDNQALMLAMQALLMGPTAAEKTAGLLTAIPSGTVINSAVIDGGVAELDFNELIDKNVAGSATVIAIRDQIEKTAKRFSGVTSVKMTVNGEREVMLEP